MRRLSVALVASFATLSCLTFSPVFGNGPTGLTDDRNARDFTLLLGWFEGEFDNDLQIWFETDPRSETPKEARHDRIHTVHTRLPDSLLGTAAFHVLETRDDDPSKQLAQHVVSLQSEKPNDGVRLRYYRIDNRPDDLADLSQKYLTVLPDCDIVLQRRGAQLEGRTISPNCALYSDGRKTAVSEEIWIGPDVYTRLRAPRAVRPSETVGPRGPVAFYKARPFDCSVDMFADSYLKRSPADRSYKFEHRHDLGDMMTVESPRDGKRYQLQLRRQRYPYYQSGGEFLLLRLRAVGAPSSVAIVTTDTSNQNISLNLGWVAASCNARVDQKNKG